MSRGILHVSDLHVGAPRARKEPAVEEALRELVARVQPELVIATGDFAHRGRLHQQEEAAAILHALGLPVLAVPGNHDAPHTVPGRFTRTWDDFETVWGTTEPTYSSAALQVAGVNSARAWRHQSGRIRPDSLARAESHALAGAAGALRVVALHHPLTAAPWRSRKRPVSGRREALDRLSDAGVELILGGHIHQVAVVERREIEAPSGEVGRGVVLATVPGLEQPRPNRHGEARAVGVYTADVESVTLETHLWAGQDWRVTARRTFFRSAG